MKTDVHESLLLQGELLHEEEEEEGEERGKGEGGREGKEEEDSSLSTLACHSVVQFSFDTLGKEVHATDEVGISDESLADMSLQFGK